MRYDARYSIDTSSKSPINHIKFQPKTNYAVIAQDSTLKLFNVNKKDLVVTYQSHVDFNSSTVNSFDFLPGTDMKIVSVSKAIQIHDISNPTAIRWYHTYSNSKFKINDVTTLSPDIISVCDEGCLVKLYDLRQVSNFKPIQEFKDSKDSLNCMDYDPIKKKLYVGSNDGGLYCYDLRMGLLLRDEFNTPITSVQTSQESNLVLLSLLNDKVTLFDSVEEKTVSQLVKTHNDKEFKIDSRFYKMGYVSGSETGELYYVDNKEAGSTDTLKLCLSTEPDSHQQVVSSLAIDDDRILVGSGAGELELVEGIR